jgi:hypothetical protein
VAAIGLQGAEAENFGFDRGHGKKGTTSFLKKRSKKFLFLPPAARFQPVPE